MRDGKGNLDDIVRVERKAARSRIRRTVRGFGGRLVGRLAQPFAMVAKGHKISHEGVAGVLKAN